MALGSIVVNVVVLVDLLHSSAKPVTKPLSKGHQGTLSGVHRKKIAT